MRTLEEELARVWWGGGLYKISGTGPTSGPHPGTSSGRRLRPWQPFRRLCRARIFPCWRRPGGGCPESV